jgi:hypothetical protein
MMGARGRLRNCSRPVSTESTTVIILYNYPLQLIADFRNVSSCHELVSVFFGLTAKEV